MKRGVLAILRFYQRFLSADRGLLHVFTFGTGGCRFTPTCSRYTYEAVDRYGIMYGLWLGLKRIVRCHPWSKGGLDPVP